MRKFFNRKNVLLIFAAIVVLPTLWLVSAGLRGQLMAYYDVARGHYRELGYGLPVQWLPDYAKILKDRYRVEYRAVSGCVVYPSLTSYVDGYDSVSMSAANRKFGHNVFKESEEDARAVWQRRQIMSNTASEEAHPASSR